MAEDQKKQTWGFGKVPGCKNWFQSSVWTVTDARYQRIQRETWPSFSHSRSQIRDSVDTEESGYSWGPAPGNPRGWRGTAGLHNDHTEVPKAGSSLALLCLCLGASSVTLLMTPEFPRGHLSCSSSTWGVAATLHRFLGFYQAHLCGVLRSAVLLSADFQSSGDPTVCDTQLFWPELSPGVSCCANFFLYAPFPTQSVPSPQGPVCPHPRLRLFPFRSLPLFSPVQLPNSHLHVF